MSVKKILHVVNISFVIPYYFGDQLTFFKEKGDIVHIACSYDDTLFKFAKKWKFLAYPLKISRKFSPLTDLISIIRLFFYIKKNNFDTVIGHTPKGALIAMTSSFLANTKTRIYFRHGLMFETSRGVKKKLLKQIEKTTSFFSTKVICVSKSVLDVSVFNNIGNPNKLTLINKGTCNGIDTENIYNRTLVKVELQLEIYNKYNISSDTKIVGYIGRLAKDKGINELILAWDLLNKNNRNIKLMLCGPIDDRDPIDDELYMRIISDNSIILVGEVDNPEIYYSIFSCFILPSFREGFPTVILEASAMQIPVITTKATGCIDSIIENTTGIYTDITPTSISEKIDFYLQNPSIANEHGINGRYFVIKNFNQKEMWNKLYKVYCNA